MDFARLLRPVTPTACFREKGYNVWCGSPIQGPDGRYHLFYSRWRVELGHPAWVTHSEIARAVSSDPFGSYVPAGIALAPRGREFWDGLCTHNPTIQYFDGRYYLYYTGNTGDGVAMRTLNWSHRNNQRIGVAVADSVEGPWERFDTPLVDVTPGFHDALCLNNPSITRRPDGGYLMVYKAVGDRGALPFGGPVVHVVATSDSPNGPFTKHPTPIFTRDGVMFPAEDPYIWHAGDRYFVIVKDMQGSFTGAGTSLALFESTDGVDWKLAANPLVSTLQLRLADGTTRMLRKLERPQLLIENSTPRALVCAVAEREDLNESYSVSIPLATPGEPG